MNLTVFGGTGYAGGAIAREAARRGHDVTSYTRTAPQSPDAGVTYRTGSVHDAAVVDKAAQDADAVVLALHALVPGDGAQLIDAMPALAAACIAGGARLGVVGGAGSLRVAPGGPRLLDGDFPAEYRPEAEALAGILDWLQESDAALDWFYLSPAVLFGSFAPGETTGSYRSADDVVVTQEDGSSEISGTDYALAFVDELERRDHVRKRFTVGH
jgi:putative NADH-flavin reductase